MSNLRKAVFSVAGFGVRFLPEIKAMAKEFLPIVDKLLVQYFAGETNAAVINTQIFRRAKKALSLIILLAITL